MKQSIIPGVSLKHNETLTLQPAVDSWLYTLTTYTNHLGALKTRHWMADEVVMGLAYSSNIQYMVQKMRRDIEQEVLRRVLG